MMVVVEGHNVHGQHHVRRFRDKNEDYHIIQYQKNECLFTLVIFLYHFVRMRGFIKRVIPQMFSHLRKCILLQQLGGHSKQI